MSSPATSSRAALATSSRYSRTGRRRQAEGAAHLRGGRLPLHGHARPLPGPPGAEPKQVGSAYTYGSFTPCFRRSTPDRRVCRTDLREPYGSGATALCRPPLMKNGLLGGSVMYRTRFFAFSGCSVVEKARQRLGGCRGRRAAARHRPRPGFPRPQFQLDRLLPADLRSSFHSWATISRSSESPRRRRVGATIPVRSPSPRTAACRPRSLRAHAAHRLLHPRDTKSSYRQPPRRSTDRPPMGRC